MSGYRKWGGGAGGDTGEGGWEGKEQIQVR
jgi:hypothetical protein